MAGTEKGEGADRSKQRRTSGALPQEMRHWETERLVPRNAGRSPAFACKRPFFLFGGSCSCMTVNRSLANALGSRLRFWTKCGALPLFRVRNLLRSYNWTGFTEPWQHPA